MLINKVRKTIADHGLIERGDRIVVGLSGGPDSVCMLHILIEIAREMELELYPVHLNHKFRPGAAERDQAYSEELCRKHGLECRSFVVDCNALAAELGMTGEEAGRKARYDAFYRTARDIKKDEPSASVRIAVAQNANDQAETILLRLLRGTGTDGLAGIAYEREERGVRVIRPLLDVYRKEIEEYCREKGLDPVTDHTNNEAIYARNRIRLELLPHLESKYNENMTEALVRLGRIAAADRDYIWRQTEAAYAKALISSGGDNKVMIDRASLAAMHPAIRRRVVFKAFAEIGLEKDITAERLEAADRIIARKQGPKVVEFPHGYRLKVAAGKAIFYR